MTHRHPLQEVRPGSALAERFSGAVPPEIIEFIKQQASIDMLNEWLRAAIRVGTIEEFIAVLRR